MDSLHIGALVAHHARYRPGKRALWASGEWLDWQTLDARTAQLANAFARAGVQHGDRVVTVLTNCVELVQVYWACARLGAVAVPLSPLLTANGLRTLLSDAAPRLIFCNAASEAAVREASQGMSVTLIRVGTAETVSGSDPDTVSAFVAGCASQQTPVALAPDDLFNIMYTSGTTGLPKGIALTHRIRAHYCTLLANAWRMDANSVALHTGALVFNGAFVTLLPALMCGAAFIVHSAFDPAAFVETVEREGVTHTMLVPSQIAAILDLPGLDPARLASLKMLVSLGAPLPVAHKERLQEVLPNRLHELYGLTEGFVTILDREDAVAKRGSVGLPPPFFDLRIVNEQGQTVAPREVGEISGRGPFLMPGYYGKPDLTAQTIRDGWLMTGDLGYVDEDDYLYLLDRMKDMIDSGGVKVYPRDIEEVIARHPAVAEAVVFGIPDPKWGETPMAAVQLRPGAQAEAEALRAWVNERVGARYQRLARLDIVASFPRSAAGKILKRELRAPHWEGHGRAI